MKRFLAPALVMFPLLGGVPTEAATAAPNGHALLINQTEGRAIVKVAEWCGAGNFRDGYGHCRPWYGAHEACPPDRHYEPWVHHTGGRCVVNYRY
jgi:hypothetical protein